MKGLDLYNKVREVPENAKKPIGGGRLKGMTDINPMWRIKALTENFGPCGLGWYYDIESERIEEGAGTEKVAFVKISLYVKYEGEWSKPIPGTGGSSFIAKERSGMYTSDECFKMALTDAISVACKALGFGADVYFEKDRTKYSDNGSESGASTDKPNLSEKQVGRLFAIAKKNGHTNEDVKKGLMYCYKLTRVEDMNKSQYDEFCKKLETPKESKGA